MIRSAAALLFTLAAAAPAQAAPALSPLEPCYASVQTGKGSYETEPVFVAGSGFDPGERVNVAIDGTDVASDTADENGTVSSTIQAPGVSAGERLFTVSATQFTNLSLTTSETAKVSVLKARLRPRRASPRRSVVFSGRGFTRAGRPVYAHYVRRGRVKRTVRLVKAPKGDCGRFSVRRRQFPFQPKAGRWQIAIDQSPAYPADTPVVRVDVVVRNR